MKNNCPKVAEFRFLTYPSRDKKSTDRTGGAQPVPPYRVRSYRYLFYKRSISRKTMEKGNCEFPKTSCYYRKLRSSAQNLNEKKIYDSFSGVLTVKSCQIWWSSWIIIRPWSGLVIHLIVRLFSSSNVYQKKYLLKIWKLCDFFMVMCVCVCVYRAILAGKLRMAIRKCK